MKAAKRRQKGPGKQLEDTWFGKYKTSNIGDAVCFPFYLNKKIIVWTTSTLSPCGWLLRLVSTGHLLSPVLPKLHTEEIPSLYAEDCGLKSTIKGTMPRDFAANFTVIF
jgi:hypothetical protein